MSVYTVVVNNIHHGSRVPILLKVPPAYYLTMEASEPLTHWPFLQSCEYFQAREFCEIPGHHA